MQTWDLLVPLATQGEEGLCKMQRTPGSILRSCPTCCHADHDEHATHTDTSG
jgi:hypothetical protein